MTGKIIVSSVVLRMLLTEVLQDIMELQTDSYVTVRIGDGQIKILGSKREVECKDQGEYNIEAHKLKDLFRIVNTISEQPLTVHFGDYSFITIQTILI